MHGLLLRIKIIGMVPCIYFLGVRYVAIYQQFCSALDQVDRNFGQMGHLTLLLRASILMVDGINGLYSYPLLGNFAEFPL